MSKSVFDIGAQQEDLGSKIVIGLERISSVFRALLWEHAKTIGLSPIQIQLLIFLANHQESLRNVSALALEFNVSKPTISDAIRVLAKKDLIEKIPSAIDRRAYSIALTAAGKKAVQETEHFAEPIKAIVERWPKAEQLQLFGALSQLIAQLNKKGILKVQRSCHSCRFFKKVGNQPFCAYLEQTLAVDAIRIDCPEHELA